MVSGGTRFARRKRSRAAPRVIGVDVRPPHKTLYEVLVVPPMTSSRQIRKIARALRRNLPNLSDLDDVCLAEQVLGRRDLRAEYDTLLARARAAKLTLPQIGIAIEGSRPAAPPSPAPFASVGRASADAEGEGGKFLLRGLAALAALAIAGARLGGGSRHETDRHKIPELPPIQLPQVELPRNDPPTLDLHGLGLDKIDLDKIDLDKIDLDKIDLDKIDLDKLRLPKIEPEKRELDRAEPSRQAPPRSTASKPRKPDPVPLETR